MPATEADRAALTPRLRVLIVDDDARIRRGLREMIDSSGDVSVAGEAASGGRALELDHRLRPDVVIVDVLLPQATDGLAVLAELANRKRGTIAISVRDTLATDAIAAGADSFIAKGPSLIDRLLPAVRALGPSWPDRRSRPDS